MRERWFRGGGQACFALGRSLHVPSSVWRLRLARGLQIQASAAELGSPHISPPGGESGDTLVKAGLAGKAGGLGWGMGGGKTRKTRPSS